MGIVLRPLFIVSLPVKRALILCLVVVLQLGCSSITEYGPIKLRSLGESAVPASENDRSYFRQELLEQVASGDIRSIQWQVGENDKHPVTFVSGSSLRPPVQVLQLAHRVASHPEAEVDGLVFLNEQFLAATAVHSLDGDILVHVGQPPYLLDDQSEVSAEQITRQFGIGPVISVNGASWSKSELQALSDVLGMLSQQELQMLRGVHFIRDSSKTSFFGLWQHLGRYEGGPSTEFPYGAVRLYDFNSPMFQSFIVGDPDNAYPYIYHLLLHEIAHAIEKFGLVLLSNYGAEIHDKYLVIALALESYYISDLIDLREQTGMSTAELRNTKEELEDQLQDLTRFLRDASPMVEAYSNIEGALPGPTQYARRNMQESFAEAFAMYHIDPNSLGRISPEVLQWFQAGEHMKNLDFEGWTRIGEVIVK